MKRFIALTACAFALTACGSKLYVGGILIGGGLDENKQISEIQDLFSSDHREFHVHALLKGVEGSEEVIGSWWYVPANRKIFESTVTATPETPVAKFFITNTRDWPPGKYKFELTHKGKAIGVRAFEVVEK